MVDVDGLTGPSHYRKVCVSTERADQWTVGVATAQNTGDEAVILDSARLTDVAGIELVGTDVLRPAGLVDSFGVWNGYPPRGMASLDRRLWQSREPIEGNHVDAGERVNFLLHLIGDAGSGSGPLEVSYRTATGAGDTWTSNVRYGIGGRQCDR